MSDYSALARVLMGKGASPLEMLQASREQADPGGWAGYGAATSKADREGTLGTPQGALTSAGRVAAETARNPVAATAGAMDPFGATSSLYGAIDDMLGTNSLGSLKRGQAESPVASGVGRLGGEMAAFGPVSEVAGPAFSKALEFAKANPGLVASLLGAGVVTTPDATAKSGVGDGVRTASKKLDELGPMKTRDDYIAANRAGRKSEADIVQSALDSVRNSDAYKKAAREDEGAARRMLRQAEQQARVTARNEVARQERPEQEDERLGREYEKYTTDYGKQKKGLEDGVQTAGARQSLDEDLDNVAKPLAGTNWSPAINFAGAILPPAITGTLARRGVIEGERRALKGWNKALDEGLADDAVPSKVGASLARSETHSKRMGADDYAPVDKFSKMAPVIGAGEGFIGGNLAQEIDLARLDHSNPKRKAFEAYAKALPDGPEKEDITRRLNAGKGNDAEFPEVNPDWRHTYDSMFTFENAIRSAGMAGIGASSAFLADKAQGLRMPQKGDITDAVGRTEALRRRATGEGIDDIAGGMLKGEDADSAVRIARMLNEKQQQQVQNAPAPAAALPGQSPQGRLAGPSNTGGVSQGSGAGGGSQGQPPPALPPPQAAQGPQSPQPPPAVGQAYDRSVYGSASDEVLEGILDDLGRLKPEDRRAALEKITPEDLTGRLTSKYKANNLPDPEMGELDARAHNSLSNLMGIDNAIRGTPGKDATQTAMRGRVMPGISNLPHTLAVPAGIALGGEMLGEQESDPLQGLAQLLMRLPQ